MIPLFTKKQHEKIGSAIAQLPKAMRPIVAEQFEKMLGADNILFSKDRFEETCKIK